VFEENILGSLLGQLTDIINGNLDVCSSIVPSNYLLTSQKLAIDSVHM
jgi:hypothetical protein